MKLIERIKISWQGSEETASLVALLSTPFLSNTWIKRKFCISKII